MPDIQRSTHLKVCYSQRCSMLCLQHLQLWDGVVGMQLTDALLDLCKGSSPSIVAIDGPAGAGKTTLANNLALAMSTTLRVQVIHMDDLYNGWDKALGEELTKTLEHLTSEHLVGKPLVYSRFNWAANEFDEATTAPVADLLILEGVGSGQSAIREKLVALLWIDIEYNQGLARVLERDGISLEIQMQQWLVQQEQHFRVEGTQNAADFILTT
jgi:uridine kinase